MEQVNLHGVVNLINQNELGKDSDSTAQINTVFNAFYEGPKTMLMVSIETGIYRSSICRYVADWHQENKIKVIKTGFCKISNHKANYLSTNPMKFN